MFSLTLVNANGATTDTDPEARRSPRPGPCGWRNEEGDLELGLPATGRSAKSSTMRMRPSDDEAQDPLVVSEAEGTLVFASTSTTTRRPARCVPSTKQRPPTLARGSDHRAAIRANGPVISRASQGEQAGELWDHVRWLGRARWFLRDLKRERRGPGRVTTPSVHC